jgi:hypothetical protein
MPAAIVAGIGALACFLPWYRVNLGAMGSALDASFASAFGGNAQGGFEGLGKSMSGMLSGLGVSGTVNAAGVSNWIGVVALLALGAAAVLHLLESSQRDAHSRSNLLVGSVALSVLGSGCALFGLSQIGGPVGVHVGLVATLLGGIGATVLSVRRMQAHGAWQQRDELAP